MTPKTLILLAAGAATLTLPAAASAQAYYRTYYQPRGDYDRRDWDDHRGFAGYPEFRGIEQHIRREIDEGLREDLLEPEDAADFRDQLQGIRRQEAREFREHGWRLPDSDRYELRERLQQLDALVDRTRDEP